MCVKENKHAQIDHITSFCKSYQEAFTQATGLEKSAALCVASDAAFLELSLQLFGLEKWNHGCCSRHLHLRHCMLVELLWDHRHFARASRIPRHHRYERCSATECRLNWPNGQTKFIKYLHRLYHAYHAYIKHLTSSLKSTFRSMIPLFSKFSMFYAFYCILMHFNAF